MKRIKVIIKRPGEKPYSTWISNTLENLQKTVDGYIETFTIAPGLVVICNRFMDRRGSGRLPHNCTIHTTNFFGLVIFTGIKDGEFVDIPCTFGTFKRLFQDLFKESVEENL